MDWVPQVPGLLQVPQWEPAQKLPVAETQPVAVGALQVEVWSSLAGLRSSQAVEESTVVQVCAWVVLVRNWARR